MNMITYFKGPISNTEAATDISLLEYFEQVEIGGWKDTFEEINAIEDKDARKKAKGKKMPYITPSGTFSEHTGTALKEHSGVIAIDIDGQDHPDFNAITVVKEKILPGDTEGRFIAYHRSVSPNSGVLYAFVDPTKHLEGFLELEEYFIKNCSY